MYEAACRLDLGGIVSKRLTAPYKSGPCKSWIKVRKPTSAAYLRISDWTTNHRSFDSVPFIRPIPRTRGTTWLPQPGKGSDV